MAIPNKYPSVIHAAADADFDKYVYFKVYAGPAGTTATINGQPVNMVGGSTIEIPVTSISGDDIYVLGSPKNLATGLSYSGYSRQILGGSAFI